MRTCSTVTKFNIVCINVVFVGNEQTPLSHFLLAAGCTCNDYVTPGGHGKCRTQSSKLNNQPFCYVNQPSTCKDLIDSPNHHGQKYSAEACRIASGT